MGRSCPSCGEWREKHDFSANQWSRGSRSRCKTCVSGSGGGTARYSPYDSGGNKGSLARIKLFDEQLSDLQGSGGGYGGGGDAQVLKLFHGTSWTRAQQIQRDGFVESTVGLLGPGIYVAREDKARRFAQDSSRHQGSAGGLVEVLVRVRNPKYVRSNNKSWRSEGHDACRADETSISPNMEWVIANRSQVDVVRISRVSLVGGPPAEPWHTCELRWFSLLILCHCRNQRGWLAVACAHLSARSSAPRAPGRVSLLTDDLWRLRAWPCILPICAACVRGHTACCQQVRCVIGRFRTPTRWPATSRATSPRTPAARSAATHASATWSARSRTSRAAPAPPASGVTTRVSRSTSSHSNTPAC